MWLLANRMKQTDAFTGKVEKMDISRYVNTDNLSEEDKNLLTFLAQTAGSRNQ